MTDPDPITAWRAFLAAPSESPWDELAEAVARGTALADALTQTRTENERLHQRVDHLAARVWPAEAPD